MMLKVLFSFVLLYITFALAQREKFCPLEKCENGQCNRCLSAKNQFKCAAFYENLPPGRAYKYTFLVGLPDVLNKKKVIESEEIRASFGNLKKADFWIRNGTCTQTKANARCYSALLEASKKRMDACQKTIINQDGAQTVGDVLCDRLDEKGYSNGLNEIRDIKIVMRYTGCTEEWTAINSNGVPLESPELLCCKRNGAGKLKFERCDGSGFTDVCPTS